MFLDCWAWCGWVDHTDTPPEYDGHRKSGDTDSINRFCLNRHEGNINGIFLDHSIRKVGLKQLWTFKWSRVFNTVNPWTAAGGVTPDDWKNYGTGWMTQFKDY